MSAFKFLAKTDNAGVSNDDQFSIPLRAGYTYDFTVVGAFTGSPLTVTTSTSPTLTFPGGAGTYEIEITENVVAGFPTIYFNNGFDRLKFLGITQWGTNKWTTLNSSFRGCANNCFTATDYATAGTASVIDYTSAWQSNNLDCFQAIPMTSAETLLSTWRDNDLKSFPMVDLSNVTSISYAWAYNDLESLPLLDLSSVLNASSALRNNLLVDVPLFNLPSMTNGFYFLFANAVSSTSYSNLLIALAAANTNTSVNFHAGTSKYYARAADDRLVLTGDRSWTITDGGLDAGPEPSSGARRSSKLSISMGQTM